MIKIAWADPEQLVAGTLDGTVTRLRTWMQENQYPGVWVTDIYRIIGWKNPGGSQFRMLRASLEANGFTLEKMLKPGTSAYAWIAYLDNGVM